MTADDLRAALAAELTPIREQLDALITDARAAAKAAQGSEAASQEAAAAVAELVATVGDLAARLERLEQAHAARHGNGRGCGPLPTPEVPP